MLIVYQQSNILQKFMSSLEGFFVCPIYEVPMWHVSKFTCDRSKFVGYFWKTVSPFCYSNAVDFSDFKIKAYFNRSHRFPILTIYVEMYIQCVTMYIQMKMVDIRLHRQKACIDKKLASGPEWLSFFCWAWIFHPESLDN